MAGPRKLLSLLAILASIAALMAACQGGESLPAAPRFDSDAPSVPSGLIADRDGQGVTLRWNANVRDADLAGYAVYRSSVVESGYRLVAEAVTTNEWTDEESVGRTTYYRVAAIDAASNQSGLTDPVAAKTANGAVAAR